jgi:hypothetical protein
VCCSPESNHAPTSPGFRPPKLPNGSHKNLNDLDFLPTVDFEYLKLTPTSTIRGNECRAIDRQHPLRILKLVGRHQELLSCFTCTILNATESVKALFKSPISGPLPLQSRNPLLKFSILSLPLPPFHFFQILSLRSGLAAITSIPDNHRRRS